MKNLLRALVAVWYLLGWILHVYLAIFNPEMYRSFADSALLPGFGDFWVGFVMSNITWLALLLAVFEIAVGLMLINKGRWVTLGLVLSISFNLFLVQLGLSFPAEDPGTDFYFNRFPNLVFVALQVYLLFKSYPETVREAVGKIVRAERQT
jgi:hypothetical protein